MASMPKANPSEYLLNTPSKDKWERIGTQRRTGVLVPLFSVYSKDSLGVGEFSDLKLLIDWAKETGNSIIQLLPMNEVGSLFCPYDSISSFALEPAYISFRELSQARNKTIGGKLKDLKKIFPAGKPYVNYAIKKEKMRLLREVYLKEKPDSSLEFKRFQEENTYWLIDFALYKALKDYHKGRPWYEWDIEFKSHDRAALVSFQKENAIEIIFQMWLQWQLYQQFKEVKEYAEAKNVLLKGDLPILVSRDSADVWQHPEFFKLELAAGAPPDMYCAKGQRWGMPTYNWERIRHNGFEYLKQKLKWLENFYDILRIDHVVGLFRIWSIPYNEPLENQGLNGFFDPKDENKWAGYGRDILLVILENTKMLLCAEDLGVIPKICPQTLKEFGIPGNDVQRWIKDWKVKHDFLGPKDYRYLSVTMLSTHDTTNWPAWWENEAGTVDEDLFIRKCSDHRRINFSGIKDKLFDASRSRHGRLCWLDSIDSVDKLVVILNEGLSPTQAKGLSPHANLGVIKGTVPEQRNEALPKEHLSDFIDLYANSYREKEKLWKYLGLSGPMREKCDSDILRAALKITLESKAIFCINTIIDLLYLSCILKGDPYQYRINTPGTISEKNWSLTLPLSLEELLKHKVNKEIRSLIASAGRV